MQPVPARCAAMWALLVIAAAAFGDVEPPVISLSLGEVAASMQLDQSMVCTATRSVQNPIGLDGKCKLPRASAFDHHEGMLDASMITEVRYLVVDDDGTTMQQAKPHVDFAVRSKWIVEYDAVDSSGNKAEQVVLAVTLNDYTAPIIVEIPNGNFPEKLEACDIDNEFQLPDHHGRYWWLKTMSSTAEDYYDGDVSESLRFFVTPPHGEETEVPRTGTFISEGQSLEGYQIDTHQTGTWTIRYHAEDKAGTFGTDLVNNVASLVKNIVVEDTFPPRPYCSPETFKKKYGHLTGTVLHTLEEVDTQNCATACFNYNWGRVVGSLVVDPPKCAFFQLSGTSCMLHASDAAGSYESASEEDDGSDMVGYNVECQEQNVYECHKDSPYVDPSAVCIDLHDSLDIDTNMLDKSKLVPTATGNVDAAAKGTYSVTYTCEDLQAQASTITRTVQITDTTPPTLDIEAMLHTYEFYTNTEEDRNTIDALHRTPEVFKCSDTCDGDFHYSAIFYHDDCDGEHICEVDGVEQVCNSGSHPEVEGQGNTVVSTVGDFAIKYQCTDAAGNTAAKCRTVKMLNGRVDTLAPTKGPTEIPTPAPTKAPTLHQCRNGLHDADETDVDCGGPTCGPCARNSHCNSKMDCELISSEFLEPLPPDTYSYTESTRLRCLAGICSAPALCTDGLLDSEIGETDIDCGGPVCSVCNHGQVCHEHTDCSTGFCDNFICSTIAPTPAPTAAPTFADCEYTWNAWDACSASCGGGSQTRTHTMHKTPDAGGVQCPENEVQACNAHTCPADCILGEDHDDWQQCTQLCPDIVNSMRNPSLSGVAIRTRTIETPAQHGGSCVLPPAETTSCSADECTCIDVEADASHTDPNGFTDETSEHQEQLKSTMCALAASCNMSNYSPWETCPIAIGEYAVGRERVCGGVEEVQCTEVPTHQSFDEISITAMNITREFMVLPENQGAYLADFEDMLNFERCPAGVHPKVVIIDLSPTYYSIVKGISTPMVDILVVMSTSTSLEQYKCNNFPFDASIPQLGSVAFSSTIKIKCPDADCVTFGPEFAESMRTAITEVIGGSADATTTPDGGRFSVQVDYIGETTEGEVTRRRLIRAADKYAMFTVTVVAKSKQAICSMQQGDFAHKISLGLATFGVSVDFDDIQNDADHNTVMRSQHHQVMATKQTWQCPIDCYSEYAEWNLCSSNCGGGIRNRTLIVHTPPANGGAECPPAIEHGNCNPNLCGTCPVEDYSAWSPCTKSCGSGSQTRTYVANPHAAYHSPCPAKGTQICNAHACPINEEVGPWQPWSVCSTSCGPGTTSRVRFITRNATHGGTIVRSYVEEMACQLDKCCLVSTWGSWSECTSPCNSGVQMRTRSVTQSPELQECYHPLEDTQNCNVFPCDCIFHWQPWETCSLTCGGGIQVKRVVVAQNHTVGGEECPDHQERVCQNLPCPTLSPSLAPTAAPTPAPTKGPTADTRKPIVSVFGDDQMTIEAAQGAFYTDLGGFCTDYNDGDLAADVVVSGAVYPQLNRTGVYTVQYGCKNKRSIDADEATRQVVVRDTICPVCTLNTEHMGVDGTIEASFPYVDDGASCSDSLDGTLPNVLTTNTVNTEQTGLYLVTYRARDQNGNWNDGACKNSQQYIRTIRVVDTLKPVIGLHYNGATVAGSLRPRRLLANDQRARHNAFVAVSVGSFLILNIAAAIYTYQARPAGRKPADI